MEKPLDLELLPSEPIRGQPVLAASSVYSEFLKEMSELAERRRRFGPASTDDPCEYLSLQLPPENRAPFRECFERYFRGMFRRSRPWPDWALRLGAEAIAVELPTLSKSEREELLRFTHNAVFDCWPDEPTPAAIAFNQSYSSILGATVGHMAAHSNAQLEELRRRTLETRNVSRKEKARCLAKIARVAEMRSLHRAVSDYIGEHPNSLFSVSEALVNAKANTYDQDGKPRATTLTEIYRLLFRNWGAVELMSGPTELCDYLDEFLVGSENDPEKKLDRVKKICRRIGIVFKGRKGQTPPQPLSLPANE